MAHYFAPFASGDRAQPAPLLASDDGVLLYLGAGLDLYPVASRYAGFASFLYVDAKPRLTRAPGDSDHAAWRAPADVARAVMERSLGALDAWALVAPEVLRFTGRVTLVYVFATLDFELASRTTPIIADFLSRVEALYVHGLYISPETGLHLPSLRTVYAIPGNASCADVDFIREHDCTAPDPSSPYYVPTRTEQAHYERICAWAGVHPYPPPVPRAPEDPQLERFIGFQSRRKKPVVKGPLRFVLIDQISWDDDLPGTFPAPPVPTRTGVWEEDMRNTLRADEVKSRFSSQAQLSQPRPLRTFASTGSLRPKARTLSLSLSPRISRPRSGGGAAQGLVRSPRRPDPAPASTSAQSGGYKVAKTVREAEAVWTERDRKERDRLSEELKMRTRAAKPQSQKVGLFKFFWGGVWSVATDRGHAHTL